MDNISTFQSWQILLGAAVALQVAASVWYLSAVMRHRAVLNASSWGLWAVLTFLNAASYASIAPSPQLAVIPILTSLSTFATFSAAIFTSSYSKLDRVDIIAAVTGLVAALAWLASGSPNLASILLQAAFVVGFIPTVRAIVLRHVQEPLTPWLLWTLAYVCNLFSTALLFDTGSLAAFAYPLTSIALHALVLSTAFVASHPRYFRRGKQHRPRARTLGF